MSRKGPEKRPRGTGKAKTARIQKAGQPELARSGSGAEPTPVTTYLGKADLEFFKDLLIKKRMQLQSSVDKLSQSVSEAGRSGEHSTLSQHPGEAASGSYENSLNLNFVQETADLLKSIDLSLAKIRDLTYGVCEECHKNIPKKRLRFIPHTRLCVDCQHRSEESS